MSAKIKRIRHLNKYLNALPMSDTIIVYMLDTFTHLFEHGSGPVLAQTSVVLTDLLVNKVKEVPITAILHHDVHPLSGSELLEHADL